MSGTTVVFSPEPRGRKFSVWIALVAAAIGAFLSISAVLAPIASAQQSETMEASWYGPGFEGATTASGEPFNPSDYTAAHKTLPFGTKLIVTYQGRSVVVRINDRGPYVAGRDLDLSQAAAEYIGLTAAGTGYVDVVYADASTPTGPYSGGAAPQQPAPQQNNPQQAAPQPEPQQNNPRPQAGNNGNAADPQYADDSAAGNQYAENGAADPQYENTDDAAGDQYVEPQPVVAAADVPPPVPAATAVEAPPLELATPGSTVERRIELAIAAPPADYTGPTPEAPAVEPAPVATDEELPSVASGLTVLPDTGGIPLLPVSGAAIVLTALVAAGIVRR